MKNAEIQANCGRPCDKANQNACNLCLTTGMAAAAKFCRDNASYGVSAAPVTKDNVTDETHAKPAQSPSKGSEPTSISSDNSAQASGAKPAKKPTDANVTASAKKTTPAEPQAAQQDAGTDTSMCDSAFSKAQTCCNNPASCLTGNDQTQYYQLLNASTQTPASSNTSTSTNGQSQGFQNTCGQMQAATDSNRRANNLLASACSEKQTLCDGSCAQLVTKYQTLIQNCNGCDSQSIYQNTLTSLNSKRQQCAQFTAQLNDMAGQGAVSNNTSSNSANCMQTASTGSGQGSTPSSATAASNAAATAATQAAQATQVALTKGQGGYTTASAKKGNFDLGDNADAQSGATPFQPSTTGKPATVTPVANGGGGGIPGGSGGGAGASARGGAANGGGAPGYTTDIDRGLRSGGGYSAAGGVGGSTDPNGTAAPNTGTPSDPKMDLRQFLPGGARDPSAIGGLTAIQAESLGIHGRNVDLWNRITIRFQAKCRSGELFDCY